MLLGQLPFFDLHWAVATAAGAILMAVSFRALHLRQRGMEAHERVDLGRRALAASVFLGVVLQLSGVFDLMPGDQVFGSDFTLVHLISPTRLSPVLGALALGAACLLTLSYLLDGAKPARRRSFLWLGVVVSTAALSGPLPTDRLSLDLRFPASFSFPRSLLHSTLLVALAGMAAAFALGLKRRGEHSARRVDTTDAALVAAAGIQLATGISLRAHPVLLWVHVLFALAIVVPLTLRVVLRSLLDSNLRPSGKTLLVGLSIAVVAQLALGILAFVVPGTLSFERATPMVNMLVTASHFLTGFTLYGFAIAHCLANGRQRAPLL